MQSRYEYDYARRGDQAGGGVDRETVKITCTFFRSCIWLVVVVVVGEEMQFTDQ